MADKVLDFIKERIRVLQEEVKAVQSGRAPQSSDYRDKVKELMYWRRRIIQHGKRIKERKGSPLDSGKARTDSTV